MSPLSLTRAPLAAALAAALLAAALLATTLLGSGCAGPGTSDAGPTALGGDPEAVAAALALMEPRAAAMADVQAMEALCLRLEIVSPEGPRFASKGPLNVRRRPATMLFRPGGARARQILETPTERLVVDVQRRHASRFRYAENGRAIVGVAALLMDLDVLARALEVRAVAPAEDDPRLTVVSMSPAPGVDLYGLRSLDLTFTEGKDHPTRLRVSGEGEDVLEFELLRVGLDPFRRGIDSHFLLDVPPGFSVSESGER